MILPKLRAQTAPLHDRVERAVGLGDRLRTRDGYIGLLERFYGFYDPLEGRLRAVPGYESVGIDLPARLKARWLRDDLIALGRPEEAVRGLPRCDRLPDPRGLAEALGCLYVLEGATLGGQYVRKQVDRAFGIGPESGGSFFASYRDRVGAMWSDFGRALTAYAAADPAAEGPILDAAAETFLRFEEWMEC